MCFRSNEFTKSSAMRIPIQIIEVITADQLSLPLNISPKYFITRCVCVCVGGGGGGGGGGGWGGEWMSVYDRLISYCVY